MPRASCSSLLLAALLTLAQACAFAASPVVIGFATGSPPFFDERGGKAAGIYPRLVTAIFRDAKIPMSAAPAPFGRVLANADRGAWGAGGILKTQDRLHKYIYTDYIFVESVAAYYHRDAPLKIARLADLRGKRVGTLRGWSYGEAFDATVRELNVALFASDTDDANFQKLQLGRLDVVLALEEVGSHLNASGNYPDVLASGLFVRQNPSYIAFRKSAANTALVKKLNKSIARMRASGELAILVRQYLESAETE